MKQAQDQLIGEWKRLSQQWQATSEKWNDLVRHRFEREFMQAYEPEVFAVLAQLQQLERVIARAREEIR